jgi:hypothetical protein
MEDITKNFLIEALDSGMIYLTYRERDDIFYSKYFLKSVDENFYDKNNDHFILVSHTNNIKHIIKSCDIMKFEVLYNIIDERNKNDFLSRAEKLKSDYEMLLSNNCFTDFDDYFFSENPKINNIKIAHLLNLSSIKSYESDEEATLSHAKNIWLDKIELHKIEILKYLNDEINSNNNHYDIESIKEIKDLILNFDATEDINLILTKEELFEYWPTLLLPAPDYINEICYLHKYAT